MEGFLKFSLAPDIFCFLRNLFFQMLKPYSHPAETSKGPGALTYQSAPLVSASGAPTLQTGLRLLAFLGYWNNIIVIARPAPGRPASLSRLKLTLVLNFLYSFFTKVIDWKNRAFLSLCWLQIICLGFYSPLVQPGGLLSLRAARKHPESKNQIQGAFSAAAFSIRLPLYSLILPPPLAKGPASGITGSRLAPK